MRHRQDPPGIIDFYTEAVLPALAERLDSAFPEFGWRRDQRGWVATNEEMTHRVLGVRADRVVAHGPAPRGFLIHGGDSILWTAYVNGGTVPRGDAFAQAVADLARRAGVDLSALERAEPRDRRADLLDAFLAFACEELDSPRGERARSYLELREIATYGAEPALGVVPPREVAREALLRQGFTAVEIRRAAVLADNRWPGRLCGAWRDERGRIKTLWARATDDASNGPRYLYLANAPRASLPPYGLSELSAGPPELRADLTLVEGLLDVHQLRGRGFAAVAATGGAGASSFIFEKLAQLGVNRVTLCFDRDAPGRSATARSIDQAARARQSPHVHVLDPQHLAPTKDPDEFVRTRGVDAWHDALRHRECAVIWWTKELLGDVRPEFERGTRREALARVGVWLGTLPARLALEQEDALAIAAERCAYSSAAVSRAFAARYIRPPRREDPSRGPHLTVEL